VRKHLPLAIFAALAVASLTAAIVAQNAADSAARLKFEALADEAVSRIEVRLELHRSLLRATLAFMAAERGEVEREQFREFVDTLDIRTRYSGVLGIGYAPLVRPGEESRIEAALKEGYGLVRGVRPEVTDAEFRTPILFLEPNDQRNRAALGYDMFSNPTRREAMITAIATGEASASGRVDLVQDADQPGTPGFLVYLPLRKEGAAANGGSMRSDVLGFVYAPYRAEDLFNAALGRMPVLPLDITVYDGEVAQDSLLYASRTEPEGLSEGLSTIRRMAFGGRLWTLVARPTAAFERPTSPLIPFGIGLLGIVLAGAIAMVARYQARAYEAIAALQRSTEHSLEERELMLQEMKHRIKNSIARVLAIARQTAAHSQDLQQFSESFSARLQAMAASQDMLTRSRWQKAELGELLRTELQQVFGRDLDESLLKGPRVMLDATTTQALGLTFHELATNALKYGNVLGGGRLSVTWWLSGPKRQRHLNLDWHEGGAGPVTPPATTGFGTRLIDMNIRRELGGTIERDYGPDGLHVRIEVPLRRPDHSGSMEAAARPPGA
jgi:CHASE1-domain containing sensor protein